VEITGGEIIRVDPLNLATNFANILSIPVIATHVKALMRLHAGLCFRNEGNATSYLEKEIGNVTAGTEVTF